MNLKFITTFDDFQHFLDKGEVVIAQESYDVKSDKMFIYKHDDVYEMRMTFEKNAYKVQHGKLGICYDEISAASLIYVIEGVKASFDVN